MGEVRAPALEADTPRRLPAAGGLVTRFTTTLSASCDCLREARRVPLGVLMLPSAPEST